MGFNKEIAMDNEIKVFSHALDVFVCSDCINNSEFKNDLKNIKKVIIECCCCKKEKECVRLDDYLDLVSKFIEKNYTRYDDMDEPLNMNNGSYDTKEVIDIIQYKIFDNEDVNDKLIKIINKNANDDYWNKITNDNIGED
ncbi:MAG: hypothetical protein J6M39_02985 [Lachnospiraceae bacterium]|nr:hypothetical protein [Lachnospiraceae bacterium]